MNAGAEKPRPSGRGAVTLPAWSTACPDWESRIVAGRGLVPFAPLFPEQAERALEIFDDLRIVDAPGSPTFAEACRPWVRDFAGAVFGAYDAVAGRRLVRDFMLLVSKKNSKSTLAAGIMLTALMRNWRISAEFLIIAPTIEVANNSFRPASDMVAADDGLKGLLHVQSHLRTITHRETGATLKVIAADNDTVSGKKATGVLVDELWLFGKRSGAEAMLREATGGLVSRPEGFVIYLSTQSDEPPAGVFRQKLNYFRAVRDGRIDDRKSLGILYEFPDALLQSKAYLDPAMVGVTNPNLGASVDREWIVDELAKARDGGEESLRGFLAKHLNVEMGLGLKSDYWPGARHWEANGDPNLSLEDILDRCDVITVGIDGGGLDDLLGIAILGRVAEPEFSAQPDGTRARIYRWLHWGHAWAHRSILELRPENAPKIRDIEAAGEVGLVDFMGDAYVEIANLVERVFEVGKLAKVGLDPVGVKLIVDELARRGISQDDGLVVGVSQGFKMQGHIKSVEVQLADGRLTHCDQSLMAWSVGNAKIKLMGNAVMVTKQASGTAKIDPLMALFDAAALMLDQPEADLSVYSAERGLVVFG